MPAHYVAFWNVENLFGPANHPHRLEAVKRRVSSDLKGWTKALYDTKIAQLSKVIAAMNGGQGPDILGLCEVEDAHVLTDLADAITALAAGRNYGIVHADNSRDLRGIDTCFIFDLNKFTVDPTLIFNHFVIRRTGTRDIVQATFRSSAGHDLIYLVNHWPSRSGGTLESAGFRAAAGETLGYWHERIRDIVGTKASVIAAGDFNDNPWDSSMVYNANSTRERGDVTRGRSARFFNVSWEYLRAEATHQGGKKRTLDGTLYFGGDGNLFDQFLLSRPLLDGSDTAFKYRDGSAGIFAFPDMVSSKTSEGPRRFGLPKGKVKNVDPTGYSDHFPVGVILDEAD